MLFFFIGIIFGFTDNYVISFIFLSSAIVVLFLNYEISCILHICKSLAPHTLSVKQPRNSIFGILFAKLMTESLFIKLDKNIRNTILSGSIKAGELQNPIKISRKFIIVFVMCVPICAVTSLFGVILFQQILFLLFLLIPFFVLLLPTISNMLSFADSSSGYDKDLAYFLSYLHISHIGKMNLYGSMIHLLGHCIFPAIERDAKMLQRWVVFDGVPEFFAIKRLANNHANKTFRDFLLAYADTSKSRPQNLDDFIANAASKEFEKTISSDEKGIGKISTIFVFGGIAMIMVPALLIMMSFAVPDADIIGMVSMIILVIPILFTALSILMFNKKSDFTTSIQKLSVLGLVLIVPIYIVTSDVLMSLSIGITITCIINGRHVSRQIFTIRSTVNGFVPFVKDLIDRRETDSNFVTSLKTIFKYDMKKKYGRFSDVLYGVRDDLDIFSDKKRDIFLNSKINSERLKMMMFVLQTIFDSGHKSTTYSLGRLHSFSERTIEIKNKIDDALKISSLLLLFSPLIFFITLSGISSLMLSFTEHIPTLPENIPIDVSSSKYFQKFDISSILTAMKPAIFVMSVCSGIVMSRVAYSSFLATLPLGICMLIASIIFVGWDFFFDTITFMIRI